MAIIDQTAPADATKFLASIWFHVPNASVVTGGGGPYNISGGPEASSMLPIFEFGNPDMSQGELLSGLYVGTNTSGINASPTPQNAVWGFLCGPNGTPVTFPPPIIPSSGTQNFNMQFYFDLSNVNQPWMDSYTGDTGTFPASTWLIDAWNNILIAFDPTQATQFTRGVYLNDQNWTAQAVLMASDSTPPYIYSQTDPSGFVGGVTFDLPMAGFGFGVPCALENVSSSYNQIIRCAEWQIWTDQYLDLGNVANRRLFVDAFGRPVDPAVPEALLGAPAYRFRRNSSLGMRFETNQGTSGGFSIIGTPPSDYSPGPG